MIDPLVVKDSFLRGKGTRSLEKPSFADWLSPAVPTRDIKKFRASKAERGMLSVRTWTAERGSTPTAGGKTSWILATVDTIS